MKRLSMMTVFAIVALLLVQAQGAMTGSSMMSGDNSMMSGSGTMSGSSGMSGDTSMPGGSGAQQDQMMAPSQGGSASTMTANPMTADPMVGNQLRFAMSTGKKVIFTNLMAAERIAAKGPAVLFFAADWCPYCQADLKDINANGSRLGMTTIIVLDYDKVADLKAKYGVTVQDTFVQIDARGNKLAVWNGGGVDGIISHVMTKM